MLIVLGAHVERAPENIRKAQDVIDLVGIVGTARGDDHVGARGARFFRRDLGVGIGHGEDDRIVRHAAKHVWRQRALDREAVEDVGAFQRLGERARRGVDGVRALPLVHALLAAAIDDALGVAQDDVARIETHRLGEIETGDAGGAGAVADEFRRSDVAARQQQRVEHAGGGDDRRAVLIVMKDRNVHEIA